MLMLQNKHGNHGNGDSAGTVTMVMLTKHALYRGMMTEYKI